MPRPLGTPLYLCTDGQQKTLAVTPSKYPTHVTMKIGGVRKRHPVAYFWKDAIRVGNYVHPLTRQKFSVDRERIDGWVDKFRRMQRNGVEVPTPVDHSEAAEDNRGFVIGAKRDGDKLKLLHQAIGKDAAIVAARNRCSVYIDPDFRDGNGKRWGEVIAHSAYTPKPVVHGQGAFVPFAASRGAAMRTVKVPAFYFAARHKESSMPSTMTAAVSLLSKKEKARLRKLMKIKEGTKLKVDELAGGLLELSPKRRKLVLDTLNAAKVRAAKAKRARANKGGDDDEDEDELDSDDDDDDIDDELEDDIDDAEGADEDEDDEDLDDVDDEDDAEEQITRRNKPAKIAASRGVVGRIDRHTSTLMAGAFKTECDAAIRSGRVSPETVDRISRLFTDRKGRPNAIALSAVPGTVDPLAFRLLKILRHNKQVPVGGKTQSQAFAASRTAPTSKKDKAEAKDIERLIEETEQWAEKRNGKKTTTSAKSE